MSTDDSYRFGLGVGVRRFATAMPDTQLADRLARSWGEAVWTDNLGFRIMAVNGAVLNRDRSLLMIASMLGNR